MAWATGRGPSTRAARVTAPTPARSAHRLPLGVAAGSRGGPGGPRASYLTPAALRAVTPAPCWAAQRRAQNASPPFHPLLRGSALVAPTRSLSPSPLLFSPRLEGQERLKLRSTVLQKLFKMSRGSWKTLRGKQSVRHPHPNAPHPERPPLTEESRWVGGKGRVACKKTFSSICLPPLSLLPWVLN